MTRACDHCGAPLAGRPRQTRYCAGACRAAASRERAAHAAGHPGAVVPALPGRETAQIPHTAPIPGREQGFWAGVGRVRRRRVRAGGARRA
jgi:hypothetical protein